jgi:hypothetical protein
MLPYVGDFAALVALDAEPFPDEPFDHSVVAPGDRGVVADVLRLSDAACDVLLDVEHRTIARRILARVAARDPRPLRRAVDHARIAAALVWLAGRAGSGEFGRRGQHQASELWDLLDVSDCSDRGRTLLRAAGLAVSPATRPFFPSSRPLPVADGALLHSSLRRVIVDDRDFLWGLDDERTHGTVRDDGRCVRAAPLTPFVARKGTVEGTGRIGIIAEFDDGTSDGWYLALSIPDAHHLVALLQHAIDEPAPRAPGSGRPW